VAVLPTGVLTVVIASLLAFAVAIKAIGVVSTVTAAVGKFAAAFPNLAARLGVATTALGVFRAALLAIAASTAIGLVIGAIALALSAVTSGNEKAAAAARSHADAVNTLTDALRSNNGEIGADARVQAYKDLSTDPVKLDRSEKGGDYGTNLFADVKTKSVAGYAAEAGITDPNDVANAKLGNEQAISRVGGALTALAQKYSDARKAAADNGNFAAADNFQAQENAAKKAAEQIYGYSGVASEAAANVKLLTGITDDNTTAVTTQAGAYRDSAAATDALRKSLAAAVTPTAQETGANNAIAAMDAYHQAVDSAAAAQRNYRDGVDAVTRATEAQNQALKDAKQRLIDLQRQLRDMTLDEKQLKLNVKESDEALAKVYNSGAGPDEIAQAQLDNERAHNALNDFEQDKGGKKKAINDEIAKGVGGNQGVKDAAKALSNAKTNADQLRRALKQANDRVVETQTAFQNAAGAIGLTTTQVADLKHKLDKIRSKQVKVGVDTTDAEAALRRVLLYQEAIKLMDAHPLWGIDRALAEAAKQVPSTVVDPSNNTLAGPDKAGGGYAQGGPTAGPVAGPVRGPGTGTSDSVPTVLPVGGPSRLSHGEHIVTDAEVRAGGGHDYIEAFRQALRSGQRWGPLLAGIRLAATGGPTPGPVPTGWAGMPRLPAPAGPGYAVAPGYAVGGAVRAAAGSTATIDRSVTVNVGTITNAVPESAGTSLYKVVRRATEGDDL
jgi:predicted  nucleic acid-binding Zn-ribbon protein